MADVVLRTRDLHKRFGSVVAVDGVSLAVERGEIFGFLGPNGAGKTTTIGMILGLVHPTRGTVELFGRPLAPARNEALGRVGALVGEPALVPMFSARDNLRCLASLYPDLPDGRIDEVLEQVGLAAVSTRRAGALSSGMKRRLGVGLALLGRPDLLVLDEPAEGLDPEGIHDLRALLRSLAGEGTTVFLSSHLLHEVELTCDRVGVVHHGRLVAEGAVADLARAPADRVTVATTDPGGSARVLRAVPGAYDIEVGPDGVAVSGLTSEVVIYHLVTGGITPREVTVTRPDLEELFLGLTRER